MKRCPHELFLHASLQIREQSSSRNASYTLELFQTDSSWNGLPCWQVICTSGSCSQEHTCVRKWHLQGRYNSVNQSINQSINQVDVHNLNTLQIADFGLSRDLQNEDYYVSHGGKIPVKWTAPEALNYRKYSTASDVWSYGVLLYEIWAMGIKPFHNCTNSEVCLVNLIEWPCCE